jgi:hypothetical protein
MAEVLLSSNKADVTLTGAEALVLRKLLVLHKAFPDLKAQIPKDMTPGGSLPLTFLKTEYNNTFLPLLTLANIATVTIYGDK